MIQFLESIHYLNHPYLSGLSAAATLLIGIIVFLKNKKSGLYQSFLWMNFVISIWFLGNTLSMINFRNIDLAIFWWKLAYTGAIFISAGFYHFYLSYSKKKKKILYFIYATTVPEIIYLWLNEDIKMFAYVLPNVGLVWWQLSRFKYLLIFGLAKYIILTMAVAISFLRAYQKERDAAKKKELKWLAIIFFILFLGASEWLPIFNIPLHIAWAAVPLFVGAMAYAILKYQLLDIRIVIKKALIYSVGIAVVSGIIVGISFLSSWFAERVPGFQFWTVPLIAGITAFIIGNLFWRKSKEVNKLKYEFITVAAHKLRTPLTEIKWGINSLKEKEKDNEKKQLLSKIYNSNEQTIELTNQLLNVAKTEAKQYQYKIELSHLEKIAEKVINNFKNQTKEKNINLTFDFEENLSEIKIDRIRISSVIQILLENAIQYTKDKIEVKIKKYKNYIILSIKDNGIGIPKEEQDHIFSRFYRTHEAYKTETEGLGLSLYLAKSIIDKHNAKIGVKSEGEGKGSEFWFRLKVIQ